MYEFLATLTLVLHFLFIVFVVFGGLLFFIKAWTLYFHIPAFLYGAYMEFTQTICPLTYLENYLLTKANLATIPQPLSKTICMQLFTQSI